MNELHLVIDWTCCFANLDEYIPRCLCIVDRFKMNKLEDKSQIISNFYGTKVNDFRGASDFNIYIIRDTTPTYDYRKTSKGMRMVNINLFDLKTTLRKITGGYKIHATDNIQETKDNLSVLGLFEKYYKQKRFSTLNDVFTELNKHDDLKWVITHNFDTFIDGDDIDFLTDDYYHFMRILDTIERPKGGKINSISNGGTSVRNYIIVGNRNIPIDIRYIGDNFYHEKFQQDMLNNRVLHPNGFYIPNETYHLYSLIYHAIIHKRQISKTYINVFKKYNLSENEINKKSLMTKLNYFMEQNGYKYVKPEPSVGYFLTR